MRLAGLAVLVAARALAWGPAEVVYEAGDRPITEVVATPAQVCLFTADFPSGSTGTPTCGGGAPGSLSYVLASRWTGGQLCTVGDDVFWYGHALVGASWLAPAIFRRDADGGVVVVAEGSTSSSPDEHLYQLGAAFVLQTADGMVSSASPDAGADPATAGLVIQGADALDGGLIMAAAWGDSGVELVRYQPEPRAPPQLLRDLQPGGGGSFPQQLRLVGDRVFFSALETALPTGREPYVTDGTPQGTHLIIDLARGIGSSSPRSFTAAGGAVFFIADDGATGEELWRTDGTLGGTARVTALGGRGTRVLALAAHRGRLYLLADPDAGVGLYSNDGTIAGTTRLVDAPGATWLASIGGVLYLDAWSADAGVELAALVPGETTLRSVDLNAGPADSRPRLPAASDGFLYLAADLADGGQALYRVPRLTTDAGDEGLVVEDGGTGSVDAGAADSGVADAGADAGPDGGAAPSDAGADAGAVDDAGPPDAAAGPGAPRGCGCGGSGDALLAPALTLLALAWRRRPTYSPPHWRGHGNAPAAGLPRTGRRCVPHATAIAAGGPRCAGSAGRRARRAR